jgi:hypothetical protein
VRTFFVAAQSICFALAIWCGAATAAFASTNTFDGCYATQALARKAHPEDHLRYKDFSAGRCWHVGRIKIHDSYASVSGPPAKASTTKQPQRIKAYEETMMWLDFTYSRTHDYYEPP